MRIKRFRSSSDLEIIAGLDDSSNDHVTFVLAHPGDLWFHVKGVSGSHVILKCGEANAKADRDSIREAAAVAAWFSKMRHGGRVPVTYGMAKQVRKLKGVKTGTVNIMKSETIIIRPALLEEYTP
jgi:predicted ribosome quality control (RQC) complex YloA/Tae2 family protein